MGSGRDRKKSEKKEKKSHKSDKKHGKDRREKRSHDKDKKKQAKHHEKEKSRKHSKEEKAERRPATSSSSVPARNPISSEDYFEKSQEFRVWLNQSEQRSFEALSSEEAHRIFNEKFVVQYNNGALPEYCYSGNIDPELRQSALHSQHRWNFRLNPVERDQLQSVTSTIDQLTNHNAGDSGARK